VLLRPLLIARDQDRDLGKINSSAFESLDLDLEITTLEITSVTTYSYAYERDSSTWLHVWEVNSGESLKQQTSVRRSWANCERSFRFYRLALRCAESWKWPLPSCRRSCAPPTTSASCEAAQPGVIDRLSTHTRSTIGAALLYCFTLVLLCGWYSSNSRMEKYRNLCASTGSMCAKGTTTILPHQECPITDQLVVHVKQSVCCVCLCVYGQ